MPRAKTPAAAAKVSAIPAEIEIEVTQEILDLNPEMVTEGIEVGDKVMIPNPEYIAPAETKKKTTGTKAVVIDQSGAVINTYYAAEYEDFEERANSLASKKEGREVIVE